MKKVDLSSLGKKDIVNIMIQEHKESIEHHKKMIAYWESLIN